MCSCEYCEIFDNSFFYRTPPVAASDRATTLTHFDATFPVTTIDSGLVKLFYWLWLYIINYKGFILSVEHLNLVMIIY